MKKISKMLLFLVCVYTLSLPVTAMADSTSVITNAVNKETAVDIFAPLTNEVKSTGSEAKSLVVAIAVVVLVISLICGAIGLTSKSSAEVDNAKKRLLRTVLSVIGIFGSGALLFFANDIANMLR